MASTFVMMETLGDFLCLLNSVLVVLLSMLNEQDCLLTPFLSNGKFTLSLDNRIFKFVFIIV